MSSMHDLAERRPELFTESERKRLASDAEFRKWKVNLVRGAKEAERNGEYLMQALSNTPAPDYG